MNQKSPEDFREEDFITDESFQNYVLQKELADVEKWERWLSLNPAKKSIAAQAKALVLSLSLQLSPAEFVNEKNRLKQAIENVSQQAFHPIPAKTFHRRRRLLIAASFVIAIVVLAGISLFKNGKSPALKEIANHRASPMSITLDDGSVVSLAPGGSISFSADFKNQREVFLTGVADFNVRHNAAKPFRVHSSRLTSTVLGTEFQVKETSDSTIVRLYTGRLQVSRRQNDAQGNDDSIILKPKEAAIFDDNSHHLVRVSFHEPINLSFHKSSFTDIADALYKKFGVQLINKSAVNDWVFTGDFSNTSVIEVVESICLIKNLNYEVKGDTIILR